MIRVPRARLAIGWRHIAVTVYVGVNIALLVWAPERPGPHNRDWQLFLWLRENPPYAMGPYGPFRYSPVAASLFNAVTFVGYLPWFAVHITALWLLRFSPLLLVMTLMSWGWWLDTMMGNAFTFVFIAGMLALRGSNGWALVYIALLCLMPRPVQLPLAIWLLWKMPAVRWPALAIFAVHSGLALLSGELGAWIRVVLSTPSDPLGYNLSPTALIGTAWLVAGIPLAVWLTAKGRTGLAGLALSPYILPMYALVLLWDVRWTDPRLARSAKGEAASAPASLAMPGLTHAANEVRSQHGNGVENRVSDGR